MLLALAACAPPTIIAPTSILTPLPPLRPSATAPALIPPTPTAPPSATASPTLTPTRAETAATRATPRAAGSRTPTAPPGPSLTATPACANAAEFLADVTVPDGAQYLPGQSFVKKWSVRNSGTCDWGPGYRLVFVGGDALTAPAGGVDQTLFALYPARAGAVALWEIPMRAPDVPGQYTGRWQARDPQGNFFGKLVFVKVEVIPLPQTATPAP